MNPSAIMSPLSTASAPSARSSPSSVMANLAQHYVVAPQAFICPLTKDIIRNPLTSDHGQSFERRAILKWLACSDEEICPVSGKKLRSTMLYPNKQLQKKIFEWQTSHGPHAVFVDEATFKGIEADQQQQQQMFDEQYQNEYQRLYQQQYERAMAMNGVIGDLNMDSSVDMTNNMGMNMSVDMDCQDVPMTGASLQAAAQNYMQKLLPTSYEQQRLVLEHNDPNMMAMLNKRPTNAVVDVQSNKRRRKGEFNRYLPKAAVF